MTDKKENIILCDCVAEEVASLCEAVSESKKIFSIRSHIANWKRTGAFSELRRYCKYFAVAFRYFCGRKKYDTIIGWQQFYALIFVFYSSIFHTKKQNKIVALNFTYKEKHGKLGKVYKWFMKKCLDLKYLDYIHVPSQGYANIISTEFHFPLENIIVSPFGINDPYSEFSKLPYPENAPAEGYALAIGRSNRDYDFLITAWENITYPLIIISDTYGGTEKGNANIRIIRNVAGEESYPWIAHCKAMIIPIDDGNICSGDTVLLTALSMKKKVLITTPSTLAEMYIKHGENGLAVNKDCRDFESIVPEMLFTDKYNYLQDNARECYLEKFSRRNMGKQLREIIF